MPRFRSTTSPASSGQGMRAASSRSAVPPSSSTSPRAASTALGRTRKAAGSASVLLPPPLPTAHLPSTSAAAAAHDSLQAIARQTVHLQGRLQSLLDAQSAGLLAGLGRPVTPATGASAGAAYGSPVRASRAGARSGHSPSPGQDGSRERGGVGAAKAPTLKEARAMIQDTLLALARTKDAEWEALEGIAAPRRGLLERATQLEEKRRGLEEEITRLEEGDEGRAVTELEEEDGKLVGEIEELESMLRDKKARLKKARLQRERQVSEQGARLSSWRGALLQVQADIDREILSEKHKPAFLPPSLPGGRKRRGEESVWALPRDRRTVGLVREEVHAEVEGLESRRSEVQREEEACLQGAEAWGEVVRGVGRVERALARELLGRRLVGGAKADASSRRASTGSHTSRGGSTAASSTTTTTNNNNNNNNNNNGGGGKEEEEVGMKGVLKRMQHAEEILEGKIEQAEKEGWRFLVVAIAAELEALAEGRAMLEEVGMAANGKARELVDTGDAEKEEEVALDLGIEEEAKEKEKETENEKEKEKGGGVLLDLVHEDDGPSADLLIDHEHHTVGHDYQGSHEHNDNDIDIDHDDGPGADFLVSHTDEE